MKIDIVNKKAVKVEQSKTASLEKNRVDITDAIQNREIERGAESCFGMSLTSDMQGDSLIEREKSAGNERKADVLEHPKIPQQKTDERSHLPGILKDGVAVPDYKSSYRIHLSDPSLSTAGKAVKRGGSDFSSYMEHKEIETAELPLGKGYSYIQQATSTGDREEEDRKEPNAENGLDNIIYQTETVKKSMVSASLRQGAVPAADEMTKTTVGSMTNTSEKPTGIIYEIPRIGKAAKTDGNGSVAAAENMARKTEETIVGKTIETTGKTSGAAAIPADAAVNARPVHSIKAGSKKIALVIKNEVDPSMEKSKKAAKTVAKMDGNGSVAATGDVVRKTGEAIIGKTIETTGKTSGAAANPAGVAFNAGYDAVRGIKTSSKKIGSVIKSETDPSVEKSKQEQMQECRNEFKRRTLIWRMIARLKGEYSELTDQRGVGRESGVIVYQSVITVVFARIWVRIGLIMIGLFILISAAMLFIGYIVGIVSYIFTNTPLGMAQGDLSLYDSPMLSTAVVEEYDQRMREDMADMVDMYMDSGMYRHVELNFHMPDYGDDNDMATQVLGVYLAEYSNVSYADGLYGLTTEDFAESNYVDIMTDTETNRANLQEIYDLMVYREEKDTIYDYDGSEISQEDLESEAASDESGESDESDEPEESILQYYVTRTIDVYYLNASEYMEQNHPGDNDRYLTAIYAIEGLSGVGLSSKQILNEEDLARMQQAMVSASEIGAKIVQDALSQLGIPYSQERRNQEGYFDCSSFTAWCYAQSGLILEWEGANTAAAQAMFCSENGCLVTVDSLAVGDLVFWSFKNNGRFMNISHVGIYAGDGYVIDTSTGRGVSYLPLYSRENIVMCARPWALLIN